MKYKVGDKVRIKSLDWYNENKDKYGQVFGLGAACFNRDMSCYCGSVLTIDKAFDKGCYRMKEDYSQWRFTDGMIEGLVEEETKPNIIEEAKTYWDSIKDAWICPEGYQFVDENGSVINAQKIVLEKKKKEYPKTYEECTEMLGEYAIMTHGYKRDLLNAFQKLLICRDAYWKIAGEEMRLGKPWEPDWKNEDNKFIIQTYDNEVGCWSIVNTHRIFAFPTPEMRDAFKENFGPDIEICKELL